jgi:hypothetical protein
MDRMFVRLAIVAGVFPLVIGCDLWPFGPSRSVAGNWYFQEGRSFVYEMSLTQTDDRIAGTVCAHHFGVLLAQEARVVGEYPRLSFTFGDCEYDMRFEEDRDQIAGDCEGRRIVRFRRGESGSCASARRLP